MQNNLFSFPSGARVNVEPHAGDVVVTPNAASDGTWIVQRRCGPAEISTDSQEDALEVATVIARELGLNVWLLDNGESFLVAHHRDPDGADRSR